MPLLVTDNLESTIASRNIENMRQIALGLSGVLSDIGLNSQLTSLNARSQSLQGCELNSLMTIGRVTDNTIRVRLGVMNQGPQGSRMAVAPKMAIAALEGKVIPQSVKLPLARVEFPNLKEGTDYYAALSDNFFVGNAFPPAASTSPRRRSWGRPRPTSRPG